MTTTGPFLRTNDVKNLVSDAWIRTHDLLNHNHKNRPLTRSLLQWKTIKISWRSSVEGDEGCIGPRCKLLCLEQTPKNYASYAWQHSILVWTFGPFHLFISYYQLSPRRCAPWLLATLVSASTLKTPCSWH